MYDAVTLWLPADMTEPPGQRFFHALSNYEERTDARTGEVSYVGTLDNLHVRSKPKGVRITGSLARFHFGSNLETLTCQQTKDVLERLSDTLGLPIESAKVTSLEFGSNLLVDRRPVEYFAQLGQAPCYRRSEINRGNGFGLYYSNSRRELAFYDKIREVKTRRGRKIRIPESLIGRNLIRYELQFLRNIGDQLATLTNAGQLHDSGVYHGLVSRWEQEYRTIRRRRTARTLSGAIGGPRLFKDQLAALGMERMGGAEAVIAALRSAKDRGEIDSQHYKRNKQLIQELAASPVVTIEPELIVELDRTVSETADRFR